MNERGVLYNDSMFEKLRQSAGCVQDNFEELSAISCEYFVNVGVNVVREDDWLVERDSGFPIENCVEGSPQESGVLTM